MIPYVGKDRVEGQQQKGKFPHIDCYVVLTLESDKYFTHSKITLIQKERRKKQSLEFENNLK